MTTHDWYVEHRAAYTLRGLEPQDERRFEDHLRRCPECRGAVEELTRDLGWLPMAVRPVAPPPGFKWRAAAHALGVKSRRERLFWPALAAAAILLVTTGTLLYRSSRREAELGRELERSRSAVLALGDTLMVMRGAERVLQASVEMDEHRGGLLIFADATTHRWNVVLHGLPPAPAGEKYQFWFIMSDGMVQGAELKPTENGTLLVTMGMPPRGDEPLGASLSVEPMTNAGTQPRGKVLAHLML